jgi:hypothetical protein
MSRSLFPLMIALAALAAGASPAHAGTVSAGQSASFRARFAAVKAWHIRFRYAGENPYTWDDHGTRHLRSRWSEASQGDFVVRTTHASDASIQVFGDGPTQDLIAIDLRKIAGPSVETRYDSGAGSARVKVQLELDLQRGTYGLTLLAGDLPTTYGGTFRDGLETKKYGPSPGASHVILPLPRTATGADLPLPEAGLVLAGHWSHDEYVAAQSRETPGFDATEYARALPVHGGLSWVIYPADAPAKEIEEVVWLPPVVDPAATIDGAGQPPQDLELQVEPAGYDAWLPRGGADETTAGNTLSVKATLVPRGGRALQHRATQIVFALADVSHEPGVALNQPVRGGQTSPDLGFEPARNPQAEVSGDGSVAKFVRGPYTSVTAEVSSFDWGGSGRLNVWARLDDGRIIAGQVPAGGGRDLLIPKRSGASRIGDAWKASVGFTGADGADDEAQPGNDHVGDGLTAYEEYRGLVLNGRSTRDDHGFDPARKDFVVINAIGADAKPGIDRFARIAALHVLTVDAAAVPTDRCVNPNRGAITLGAQHAVRLTPGTLADGRSGELRPAANVPVSPAAVDDVVVDRAAAARAYARRAAALARMGEHLTYSEADDLAQVLARLLAQALGAREHGDVPDYSGPTEITTSQVGWRVFDSSGKALVPSADKPVVLDGRIGRPGNAASGDSGCLLCQPNDYAWAAVGKDGRPLSFYAIAAQPLGDHLCTSKRPLGINVPHRSAAGVPLPGFFGYAEGIDFRVPRGNCLGALRVSDP